ncbi:MAG: acetyl-CoA carboxylase biotin carboxylase subunit [Solirubrobacterales bacterium]
MFTKVLVANRGEIAIRVFRALKELDVASVAVYSDADKDSLFVQHADEAYTLGEGAATETYLVIDKIIDVAKRAGAEAIHPGYGFLAENADFAQRCQDEGIVWIGPPPSAIDSMGSKTNARELMAAAGVPIVPGTTEPVEDVEAARAIIDAEIGYPVAVKAASGGGGKGFRVALTADELEEAFEGASREGEKFFADGTVYLERYLPNPRHVEVQIIADNEGNVIHLGERDCSVQRRHQKLIEEAPAPAVSPELRAQIGEIGVNAAKAVDYRGAGTIEGMLQDGEYYFLEMNTRVQVEHCVTEEVTGINIVKEGIRVAAGAPLSVKQEDIELRGHSIECRINFEDAGKNFAPAPGKIGNFVGAYVEPSGPGIRVDSGVTTGSEISPLYDPMAAKLIVWAENREEATKRMIRALGEYKIDATTLIPFHIGLLESEQWGNGETCKDLTEDKTWLKQFAKPKAPKPAEGEEEIEKVTKSYTVEVSGKRYDVKVEGEAAGFGGGSGPAPIAKKAPKRGDRASSSNGASSEDLTSPLQGTVFKVTTEVGAEVSEGDVLFIIEAMKMENEITAHRDGKVDSIAASEGASVSAGDTLAIIK